MLVYRIEDWDGNGPFRRYYPLEHAIEAARNKEPHSYTLFPNSWDAHPTAENEQNPLRDWWNSTLWFDVREWRFGAESLEQARHWIPHPKSRADFVEYGFIVAHYEIHGRWVKKGKYQIVFNKPKATMIGYTELYNL